MPALPSSILEPLWVQVAALLPARHDRHPLGCHRPRISDRMVSTSSSRSWCSGAATVGSPTTPARRPPCAAAVTSGSPLGWPSSCAWRCWAAYDRLFGLNLDHLAVDGCTTKAPCGGQSAGPSPVDRRKQGLKRSVAVEAAGIPLAVVPAPANHRDDRLLAATLDAITTAVPLPEGSRCTWMPAVTTSRVGRS